MWRQGFHTTVFTPGLERIISPIFFTVGKKGDKKETDNEMKSSLTSNELAYERCNSFVLFSAPPDKLDIFFLFLYGSPSEVILAAVTTVVW